MANEYLTFKNVTLFESVLSMLFGLGFVLMPEDVLDMYDVTLSPNGYHVTKLFGAAFILIALVLWFIKDMEKSDLQKNLSISFIVGNGLGAILTLLNILDDDTEANGLEWLNIILYGILAVAFGYLVFIDTDEVTT